MQAIRFTTHARGLVATLSLLGMVVARDATAQAIDWKAVDAAMGRTGAEQPGGVHRYGMPRSDMHVKVAGVAVEPALALGSWIAFLPTATGTLAMGDLVLADGEVDAVISRLQRGGIEQSAIHHHLLHESPRVLYVHVHAMGDPVKIAGTVRAALSLTKTPAAAPAPTAAPAAFGIDTAAIGAALGHAGRVNGGVYQVSVPRSETIREGGVQLPPAMGVATAINFQPTGSGKAAITGDFVLLASEVSAVARALREHGIEVTALHNHLMMDEPRLFFMHFWANDDAVKLAGGLKAALDLTAGRGR